ncbi:MAG: CDC48 family AAA ATPase [Chloroflexi bacterium]|nr:CDC48 family AAA ATPase [Chloroflexota bacterium]
MAEADAPTAVRLNVAEALSKDVGRGIARLDRSDMEALNVRTGDIVRITGKRVTAAKVMPALPEMRGRGVVQIDGLSRDNAQAAIGEPVVLQHAEAQRGRSIVLAPLTPQSAGREADAGYLARALEGLPVCSGDRVRATLLGGRFQEFTVAGTDPEAPVLIGGGTTVRVRGGASSRQSSGATYEDVGALRREIHKIREMVELPLRHPELFDRLGIDPPRGVLLHGPPGCGKTLIARAVANETDATFFHISGPEIIHKFYGESEAHLRAIFERAKAQSPAIIFIDEIDAIAAKREEARGDQQVERRVVAQLLALMDGLQSRGQVIVIGATNLPHALDPALRRPGRFDREIAIGVPDAQGRLEILLVHTRGMPLAADVSLDHLAGVTHGFVGADLEALCREAAMATLRRAMARLRVDSGGVVPYEIVASLEVTADDFHEARKDVEPSALREFFAEVPNVTWEDIGGLETVKRSLQEAVEWPLKYPSLFRRVNAAPPRGILLSGPPGTGKTLLAKAVATQSGANFISVKGPVLLSRWVGESERGIREVFRKARQASPCVIFFDEIDALAPARGTGSDSSVTERVISQLLTEMDGIEDLKGVTVLAATNRPDLLDRALIRTGRFDVRVEVPLPDETTRREILAIHLRGTPLSDDVSIDRLAAVTDGATGSDITAVCRRAAMLAIRAHVEGQSPWVTDGGSDDAVIAVTERHFQAAIAELGSHWQ